MQSKITRKEKIVNETKVFTSDNIQNLNSIKQEIIPDNLGEQLKAYRKSMAYTQKYFASLLRISASTLSRYETNRQKPGIKTFFLIKPILGI